MKTIPTRLEQKKTLVPDRVLTGPEKVARGIAIVISIASVLMFCLKILFF